jgi:lipopolysaccharide export system ATP-binding protein
MQVHDEEFPTAARPLSRPQGGAEGQEARPQIPPLEPIKAPPLEPLGELPPRRYSQPVPELPPRRSSPVASPDPVPVLNPAPSQPPAAAPEHLEVPSAAVRSAGQQGERSRTPAEVMEMEPDQVIRHRPRQPVPHPDEVVEAPRDSSLQFAPHEQRQILLHTHGLKKVYDGRAVVNGVDVNVREREIVGLLGPNGAGKTTSFYMIVGLVQPTGGRVMFDGHEVSSEPMYVRGRMGMGYLPQEESIFRKLTVEENIMAVMETQKDGLSRSDRRERCQALMRRFGIDKLAKNVAITLSGGEKRRLTIARSLVTNPKLLMLDEPFSGVDPIAVGEIQEIIRDLRSQGLAILITDHNVRETLGIVDRAYLLFEGTVRREGTRDFLINDPLSRELYLGERFSM